MTEHIPHMVEVEVQFPQIAAEINAMAKVDQDMRGKWLEDESWNEEVDPRNTARMKELIAEAGWLTVSKVGNEASHNAWLLVQHADHDVVFQEECLDLMKREPTSEVALRDIAMLEDRVCINSGRPQIYGTQFNARGEAYVPREIEDPEHVDERRAAMGLDSLAENIARMHANYGPPKSP
jgi:hypothetical protein